MKKVLKLIIFILLAFLVGSVSAYAAAFVTGVGGTGTTTPSGILYGDNGATSHLNTVTIGSGCTFVGGTLSCSGNNSWPFTPSTNYGLSVQSTSTPIYDTAGIQASSTSYFSKISVAPAIDATDISDFAQPQTTNDTGGYIRFLGAASGGTVRGYFGFAHTGSGGTTIVANELANALIVRSENAFQLATNGNTLALTVDASQNLGISSTSPFATLSVNPIAGKASNQFVVGSSTATALIVNNAGFVGIATTSPASTFTVNGAVTLHGLGAGAGAGALCATADGLLSYSNNAGCTGAGSGTVTSITAGTGLSGGVITTTGTITNPFAIATSSSGLAISQLAYYTGVTGTTLSGVATGTVSAGSSAITVTANRAAIGGALAIDCATAGSSQNGCLSSTDWTTFNSKQAPGFQISTTTLPSFTLGNVAYVTGTSPTKIGGVATSSAGTAGSLVAIDASSHTAIVNATTTSLSASGELNAPHSGTVPTLTSGDVYVNTNSTASSSIAINDGSATHNLFAVQSGGSIIASSTLAYDGAFGASGTTTLKLPLNIHSFTVRSICATTDVGTVWFGIGNGTATTTEVQGTSSGACATTASNNTFNGRQQIYIEVGRSASSPNNITVSVDYENTN